MYFAQAKKLPLAVRHTVEIYEPDMQAVEVYNTIYEQTYLPARRLFI